MDVVADIRDRLAAVSDPIALLEGIFARAPVGFQIYAADGHSLLVNPAFRELFGSEPPSGYNVLEDDIARERGILDLVRRAFAGETITTPPIWYDPRELRQVEVTEGRRVGIEATFFPLHDRAGAVSHVAIVFKDVSAELDRRERAEAEARSLLDDSRINEALYRIGVALSKELDEDRLIHLVTSTATEIIGAAYSAFFFHVPAPEGPGHALHVAAGLDQDAFNDLRSRATALFGPTFRGEGIVRLDDVRLDPRFGLSGPQPQGHAAIASYLAAPVVTRSGAVLGGLFFGHPEPARFVAHHERLLEGLAGQAATALENARLYGELRASEQRAREAHEVARQAERRKDEFLAMLGHELRNPLAPIVTSLELMKMRGDDSSPHERAVIERQVRHLTCLVNDLLDVSRITRGKIALRVERVELAPVVAQAVEMVAPLLEERGHTLTVDVAPGLAVDGDPARLAQVIANLLNNAAKYTDPGGRIAVSATREGAAAVVAVRDNGPGIRADLLPRIFDPFAQGPQAPDRSLGGLGLGLALVKNLVELHGGAVSVESDANGSVLRVRLVAAEAWVEPSAPRATSPTVMPQRGHLRVLVVDDNCDVADTIASALRTLGFEVRIAYDGPTALGIADELRPEVALLDIGLPLMDGYEVARRLRERGHAPRIIAVTGYGEPSDRARSEAMGFSRHLVKPVDLAQLLSVVGGER